MQTSGIHPKMIDNVELHRYEMKVDGGTAFITYDRVEDRMTLLHTEVPPRLAGRGIASALAKTVLDEVRRGGLRVDLRCAFLKSFVQRHPTFSDLLVTPEDAAAGCSNDSNPSGTMWD